ncbi:MAG: hypothetical protein H0W72_13120 [Planctomycetes bacterium]|nr:hypothetical protein [Planctomycetota bacterium]
MATTPDLQRLATRDGRYDVEAYCFVSQSLRHAAKLFGKDKSGGPDRHLTAEQLIDGALDLAVDRFGLLAELVLRQWGVKKSEDLGTITFSLIDNKVFTKRQSDRIEDFYAGPDFGPALRARAAQRLSQLHQN